MPDLQEGHRRQGELGSMATRVEGVRVWVGFGWMVWIVAEPSVLLLD